MAMLEKVIAGLEFTKAMVTFNPSTGEDIEPGNLNEENKTTYDACVGAIALLKKQEAVEPVEEFRKGANCHVYHCKRCGNIVGTILGGKRPIAKLSIEHFCDVCGQAVKWDD